MFLSHLVRYEDIPIGYESQQENAGKMRTIKNNFERLTKKCSGRRGPWVCGQSVISSVVRAASAPPLILVLGRGAKEAILRYRIYFEAPDGEKSVREVEAPGEIVRVCDDHGRTVVSQLWPETQEGSMMCAANTTQPRYFA